MLKVLSLFAGIGGFDLGLERTGGFKTVAFCEIEPFAVRVLNKNWPGVPVYGDVRELTAERLRADGIVPDVIVGGFPCQDISYAGPGEGLAGERSGLWFEYARLVGELRPRFIVVENVTALLTRGVDAVLGTLAALGYDAEWHCVPASAVGAPHYRDRIWIVAHAVHDGHGADDRSGEDTGAARGGESQGHKRQRLRDVARRSGTDLANAERGKGIIRHDADMLGRRTGETEQAGLGGGDAADANDARRIEQWRPLPIREKLAAAQRGGWWRVEPNVGRVAHGVPNRVDRLRCLGNAVVPQIPELIGHAILASMGEAA